MRPGPDRSSRRSSRAFFNSSSFDRHFWLFRPSQKKRLRRGADSQSRLIRPPPPLPPPLLERAPPLELPLEREPPLEVEEPDEDEPPLERVDDPPLLPLLLPRETLRSRDGELERSRERVVVELLPLSRGTTRAPPIPSITRRGTSLRVRSRVPVRERSLGAAVVPSSLRGRERQLLRVPVSGRSVRDVEGGATCRLPRSTALPLRSRV